LGRPKYICCKSPKLIKMKKTILRFGLYGVSLLFVFFGIKHFRDRENNGVVTFAKALLIGVLISLIVSVAFGILDIIYVKFVNPDFMTDYYEGMLEQAQTLPAEEFEIRKEELNAEKEMFLNPFMHFFIMSMMVFVIGFIISLLSALLLQRKNN